MTNTTSEFEADLLHSKKIEDLFRQHPKFPFLSLGTSSTEWTLYWLFWLYMAKPYIKAFGQEEWKEYSGLYDSYSIPREDNEIPPPALHFYGVQSRRWLQIGSVGYFEDKRNEDHFQINTGMDDFFVEYSGNPADALFFLGMGVDLRHPQALDKAREFMHAFFVEKLPLAAMEQKMENFDKNEAHQFKRGASFTPITGGNGDYSSINAKPPAITARFADICPATGFWYCKGITTEQGIYLRKGDAMPGQSYNQAQRDAMVWTLVKPV